jgi:hypothetical protein
MTNLTLTIPEVGEKNTVADPRTQQAFEAIRTFINTEQLSSGNIKEHGIEESRLSEALIALIGAKVLGLTVTPKTSESVTAASGEVIEMLGTGGHTVTLPAPTINRVVGVISPLIESKVKTPSGAFFGDFISSATTIALAAGQHVLLIADGANWFILAGEPKREQTYSALAAQTAGTEYTPSTTRDTQVALEFSTVAESGEIVIYDLKVNGTRIAAVTVPFAKAAVSGSASYNFRCPVAQAYLVEHVGGGATGYKASYLSL